MFEKNTMGDMFLKKFKYGRVTSMTCNSTGLLPDAEAGCSSLEDVFINHVFKANSKDEDWAWAFTTAISGAHTLGGAALDRSGFNGSWTSFSSKGVFDNQYYKNLLLQGWGPNLAVGGKADRN